MQLSAFFPFYRNHNTLSADPQEPYRWSSVIDATKKAMAVRFALLPYMYTLFYLAHTTGSTVMRALAWEFPNDPSLANADLQFLLGPAILVTPVLAQGATSVNGVFPGVGKGEVYYNWYNQSAVTAAPGQNVTLDAPLGHINVFVRGGYVLPMQGYAMTTRDARKTPWSLLVALGLGGAATGELYLDDGESINSEDTLTVEVRIKATDLLPRPAVFALSFTDVSFSQFAATQSKLYASGRGTYTDANPLANITILGVSRAPGNITLNGMSLPSESVLHNDTRKTVVVSGLQNMTSSGAWSSDWVLLWMQ